MPKSAITKNVLEEVEFLKINRDQYTASEFQKHLQTLKSKLLTTVTKNPLTVKEEKAYQNLVASLNAVPVS